MVSFDEAYEGVPPWDIGRPQPAFVGLARSGEIQGRVLDAGCGTGENSLFFANLGLEAWGIDASPRAIAKAQAKAKDRGLGVTFRLADALAMQGLGERFDVVVDSGLFHVFTDAERVRYVDSLRSVLRPKGRYFMMCFSDREPGTWGPRRVSQEEIRSNFREGWRITYIREAWFETNIQPPQARAWLSSISLR